MAANHDERSNMETKMREAIQKLNDAYELISQAREMLFEISAREMDEPFPTEYTENAWQKAYRLGDILDALSAEC